VKKENKAPADGCRGFGCARLTSRCLLTSASLAETLILFLLPSGRPQQHLAGVEEEAYAMGAFGLFLLPRGRP
jgi:hypothetical protein